MHVLGDSWSFVSSNEEKKSITLRGASNVIKAKKPTTSKSGEDLGSTFVHLSCRQCQADVGVYYLTTTRRLDSQRDLFTFFTDAICSYQLGTQDSELSPSLQLGHDTGAQEIGQIKKVILALHHRICHLEGVNHVKLKEVPSAEQGDGLEGAGEGVGGDADTPGALGARSKKRKGSRDGSLGMMPTRGKKS
ncbi:unnamed protein product [Discosporangium mesarthrocarpum]